MLDGSESTTDLTCGRREDRRRVWRAATRAAQEVRETGKVAGKERREWEKGETERRESNTLHIVLHLQPTAEALAAAAVALHEVPSHDLLPQPFIARDRFVAGLPFGVHQRVLQ